ncbi:serine/arginine repetitive matrix protein 1-like [Anolis sagrei]|uniref:serine/arginine repetitive matrix protein 1-like n=1 Tax=Anolis sagrei TaxID=38937 RepID=UPI00352100B6
MPPWAYLDPGFGEAQPLAQLLPHEGVWVVRLVKQSLQLVQLLQRKIGSASPLLQFGLAVLVLRLHLFPLVFALIDPCGRERWTGHPPPPPPPSASSCRLPASEGPSSRDRAAARPPSKTSRIWRQTPSVPPWRRRRRQRRRRRRRGRRPGTPARKAVARSPPLPPPLLPPPLPPRILPLAQVLPSLRRSTPPRLLSRDGGGGGGEGGLTRVGGTARADTPLRDALGGWKWGSAWPGCLGMGQTPSYLYTPRLPSSPPPFLQQLGARVSSSSSSSSPTTPRKSERPARTQWTADWECLDGGEADPDLRPGPGKDSKESDSSIKTKETSSFPKTLGMTVCKRETTTSHQGETEAVEEKSSPPGRAEASCFRTLLLNLLWTPALRQRTWSQGKGVPKHVQMAFSPPPTEFLRQSCLILSEA